MYRYRIKLISNFANKCSKKVKAKMLQLIVEHNVDVHNVDVHNVESVLLINSRCLMTRCARLSTYIFRYLFR